MHMDDIVPDSPEHVLTPNLSELAYVTAAIEHAEALASELLRKAVSEIAGPIVEAEALIARLHGLCEGEICHHLSNADTMLAKLQNKLAKQAWEVVSNAYVTLSQFGIVYPTQDQVIYGLTSGDYLGSVTEPGAGQAEPTATDTGMVGGSYSAPSVVGFAGRETGREGSEPASGSSGTATDFGSVRTATHAAFLDAGTEGLPGSDTGGIIGSNPNDSTGRLETSEFQLNPNVKTTNSDTGNGITQVANTTGSTSLALASVPVLRRFGAPCTETTTGPFMVNSADSNFIDDVLPSLLAPLNLPEFPHVNGFQLYSYNWLMNRDGRNAQPLGETIVAGELGPFLFEDHTGFRYQATLNDQFWRSNVRAVPVTNGKYKLIAFECDPCQQPKPPCYSGTGTIDLGDDDDEHDIDDTHQPPPPPPNQTLKECEGILPIMPRFDDGAQCLQSNFNATELANRFGSVMDQIKPTSKGPFTRPSGTIAGAIWDVLDVITFGLFTVTGSIPYAIYKWFDKIWTRLFCMSGCDPAKVRIVGLGAWVMGVFNRMSGGTFNFIGRPWQHWLNSQCPYELPSVAEANGAYLSGVVDKVTWECWVKAQGARVVPQEKMLEAARARPNINEVTILYLRKVIDEEAWKKAMRENGVTKEEDRERYLKLVQAFPGVEDIIRFLVRDVGDKELVEKFGMDDEFDKKWQGQLIEYAKAQGISDELAKNYWRAHWYLPSPTQLYQMLHKYADDRKDVPDDLKISPETIRAALQQQDILPYWIDRLVGVSYHPLTRVDAQRAFKIGAIDEEQLYGAYRDQGYDDKNAKILVEFVKKLIEQADAKVAGLPTKKTYIDAFIRHEINGAELIARLQGFAMSREAAERVHGRALEGRRLADLRAMTKSIEKRFKVGMLDVQDATSELVLAGVDSEQADEMVAVWEYVRTTSGKMPSVSQLCSWASNGWITSQQHLEALKQLKYPKEWAELLVGDCTKKANDKMMKEAERVAKQRAAAEEKAAKKKEKEAAKLLAELRKAYDVFFDEEMVGAKLLDKLDKWYAEQEPTMPAA